MRYFISWAFVLLIIMASHSAHAEHAVGLENYFKTPPVKIGFGKYFYKDVIHAYNAILYSEDGKYDANKIFAIELIYKMEIDGDDIADKTIEQMNKTEKIDKTKADAWDEQLKAIMPDVEDGTHLIGVNMPGEGVIFLQNGKAIGEIKDTDFARRFFASWLSPNAPDQDLRLGLLGR